VDVEALTDERRRHGRWSGVVLAPRSSGVKSVMMQGASRWRRWQTRGSTEESAYKP